MSLSNLTIVRASDAQTLQATKNVYPMWGAPRGIKTVDDYIALWDELDNPSRPWSSDGKSVSWALVPRDDPTTTDLLAHCETYRRTALVRVDGQVQERTTYVVASVFTPEQHRKRGYAKHMLRLLHYVLAPKDVLPPFPSSWGAPPTEYFGNAAFSVLYSDVGRDFYAACTQGESTPGWVADSTPKRIFRVPEGQEAPDTWQWMDVEAVSALEAPAAEQLKSEFASGPGNAVVILPTGGWYAWYPTRKSVMARAAGKDGAHFTARCGVRVPSGGYIVYTPEVTDSGVTRLVVGTLRLPVSFEEISAVARKEGATEIELWGGYEGWNEHEHTFGGEDHIPALAQYGLGEVTWERCEQ